MNSKMIVIKVKYDLDDVVKRLEDSAVNHVERYYTINEQDSDVAVENNSLQALAAFVIFEPNNEEKKDIIKKIYIGQGTVLADDRWGRIKYTIKKCLINEMAINDFASNSELDLKNDFESHSYVIVEDNAALINQLQFVMNEPYCTKIAPVDEQKARLSKSEIEASTKRGKGLHPYAQTDRYAIRAVGVLAEQEARSAFQRDYERIVHAKAYRRLVDKAQIFTSAKGDHYRTRMTHTAEVSQIARAIAHGLNLNVELTEAIALAHDLGHTPFGHQGERTLDKILKNEIEIIKYTPDDKNFYGGFKHNFQGIRVANVLEEKYVAFDGIDLTYQVLEGILKHTKTDFKDCESCENAGCCKQKCYDLKAFIGIGDVEKLYPQYPNPTTLEGQIVVLADEIAQRSHDLDDAFSSGALSLQQLGSYLRLRKAGKLQDALEKIDQDIEEIKAQGRVFVDEDELVHSRIVSEVINYFIRDVIKVSDENMIAYKLRENDFYKHQHRFSEKLIKFSTEAQALCDYLEKIITKKVLNCSEVVRFDNKGAMIVEALFRAYYTNPKLLHKGTLRRVYISMRQESDHVIDFLNGDRDEVDKEIKRIIDTDLLKLSPSEQREYAQKKKILVRAIADYISGMTDSYALNEYNSIYK